MALSFFMSDGTVHLPNERLFVEIPNKGSRPQVESACDANARIVWKQNIRVVKELLKRGSTLR